MKCLILVLLFLGTPITSSDASPLLIRWTSYRSTVPVTHLVLYRAVNNGELIPRAIIWDITATGYMDNAVRLNRLYCFQLRAVTDTGEISPPSNRACTRPLR